MTRKSVLVISQRPPYPPNKGEKLRTFYHIRYLIDNDVSVYVACPTDSDDAEKDLKQLEATYLRGSESIFLDNPKIRKASAFFYGQSISEAYFYASKLKRKIERLVENKSIDAVLVTASSLIHYVDGLNIPVYMDFMDLDSDKWKQYKATSPKWLRWVFERESKKISQLEMKALQRCKECYFISNNEIDLLKASVGPKASLIKKISNGISNEEFHPPESPRRKTIVDDVRLLFVGVMDYKPNEDAVLWFVANVWDALLKVQPKATFSIVGMNPSKAILGLAAKPGITITGKVDTVLPYFHDADIFIAPFRLARGVQNKVLQSFACGLPVLTSAMGLEGIEGDVKRCAQVAEAPLEYINAITDLIANEQHRLDMSHNGIELIKTGYSWQSVLQEFMTDIVKEQPSR